MRNYLTDDIGKAAQKKQITFALNMEQSPNVTSLSILPPGFQ